MQQLLGRSVVNDMQGNGNTSSRVVNSMGSSSHACTQRNVHALPELQVREANQMVEEMMLLANCTGERGLGRHVVGVWGAMVGVACWL